MKTTFEDDSDSFIICHTCGKRNPIDMILCLFCGANLSKALNRPKWEKEINKILREENRGGI